VVGLVCNRKEENMGELLAPTHLMWILLIAIVLFGAKKIPELAKGLGQGLREFKKAGKEVEKEIESNKGDTAK
jgi:sec-independent protein translocase protein TatA